MSKSIAGASAFLCALLSACTTFSQIEEEHLLRSAADRDEALAVPARPARQRLPEPAGLHAGGASHPKRSTSLGSPAAAANAASASVTFGHASLGIRRAMSASCLARRSVTRRTRR